MPERPPAVGVAQPRPRRHHRDRDATSSARRSTTSTSTGSRWTATATSSSLPATPPRCTRSTRRTGKVLWRLGGKRSDFSMGKGTRFGFQHDARLHEGGRTISLFDNGPRAGGVRPESRAIVLSVDQRRRQATLKRDIRHRRPLFAFATGANQLLPNGNRLVTWGITGWFTEYDAGRPCLPRCPPARKGPELPRLPVPLVGEAAGAAGVQGLPAGRRTRRGSTRAGTARPSSPPGGSRPGETRGASPGRRASEEGFETSFAIPPRTRYAPAVALDAEGKPLRRSRTIRLY